jgi:hypothetical protein
MGLIQYLYTETDKLSFFDVAHDAYAAGQHIRPNDPNKPEGEWNYPPTDTVLETAGLRPIEENIRRRRDTALCFASERYAIYRQCLASFPLACTGVWYPLSSLTVSILTLVYVCICTVPVQIILY